MDARLFNILQVQQGACDLIREVKRFKKTLILCISKDDVTAVKPLIDEYARFSLNEISQILCINLGTVFVALAM